MTRDFKHCGLEEGWREKAHDHDIWRQDIAKKTEETNAEYEKEEQHRKNENRRKHEEREIQSEIALNCDWPGCSFHAKNRSRLINHQRQSHGTLQLITVVGSYGAKVYTTISGSVRQDQLCLESMI